MPNLSKVKNSFTFVKGLISEASPLIFPEDASIDESNFLLKRDGSREKRLGLDYEEGYSKIDTGVFLSSNQLNGTPVSSYVWKHPANYTNLNILVVQVGYKLNFFTFDNGSISAGLSSESIDLSFYINSAGFSTEISPITFTSGRGILFVNHVNLFPLYIKYDPENYPTNPFRGNFYQIAVRDFEGIDDSIEVDDRPAVATAPQSHIYNLLNAGWGKEVRTFENTPRTVIDYEEFAASASTYPSKKDIPYYGMSANSNNVGDLEFRVSLIKDGTYFGNSPAPNGHFILDAMNKNRNKFVSDAETNNPSKVAPYSSDFFFGRLFTAIDNTVYFSKIINTDDDIGKCYQEADPTSEVNNEIVDTDGGEIKIPEAGIIYRIVSLSRGVIVFATNGIWNISGGDSPFTATNLQVTKLYDYGVDNPLSVIKLEDTVIFFNEKGIYLIDKNKTIGNLIVTNISVNTIQDIYLEITPKAREEMQGVYDPIEKKVYWMYNSDLAYTGSEYNYRYNSILILDTLLGAFYKYDISELTSNSPHIYGAFISPGFITVSSDTQVVDSSESSVIDSSSNNVIVTGNSLSSVSTDIVFISLVPGTTYMDLTFSLFKDNTFVDWKSEDSVGSGYEAFLVTGYNTEDDILRNKQAPYIQCAFNRTESRYIDNGSGGVTLNRPSSCLLEARWEWSDNSVSGRISDQQQVYRFRRPIISGVIGDTFDNGFPVVTTKSKIRGKGKALNLKFTSPAGYDCQLLGWGTVITGGSGA